ncbi:SIMPL domain-containing protein [Candidatus Saccharibacteria bacterium]|nr:SIMPL domain-containing protein [Candidatus Saccharibacteria bacterium]
MQIFVDGYAEKQVAPDQIIASASFHAHANDYNEAMQRGVEKVKNFIEYIENESDFEANDFKTYAYNISEHFHTNRIEAKTEEDLEKNLTRRVSDGFFFEQRLQIIFDYNKERLARLLALTSNSDSFPHLHIEFTLKDYREHQRTLLADAYADARSKASALVTASEKHLRDCVRVEIDGHHHATSYEGDFALAKMSAVRGSEADIQEQIKAIDETFRPDDITVSKSISCVWETSD